MSAITLSEQELLECFESSVHENDHKLAEQLNNYLKSSQLSKSANKKRKKLEAQIYKEKSGFFYRHPIALRALLFLVTSCSFFITLFIIATQGIPLSML